MRTGLAANGALTGVAGPVNSSSLHVEITAITATHLLYVVGRVYENSHCGADLIAIG